MTVARSTDPVAESIASHVRQCPKSNQEMPQVMTRMEMGAAKA